MINVAFLPVYPNPYQRLLRAGLAAAGVAVTFVDILPTSEWLHENRNQIDILHYHWLYGLYMARFATPVLVARFVARLRLARRLGYRVVWTAHNILPHRAPWPPLHRAIRRLMMAEADAVIVHCEHGRRELLARFPRTKPVVVIPIGHYGGVYPLTMTRAEARAALGLGAAEFVYLALGNIAAYKGLESFAEAFSRIAGAQDVAIIAGRNRDAALVSRLRAAVQRDRRLCLYPEFVPDDRMQCYLLAADVMVAPFEHVLTSSSVMVGLSYGLPVIAPDRGCLPELVTAEAGLIYRAEEPDGLARALTDIQSRDLPAMSASARRVAAGYDWDDIGRRTAAVYQGCLTP